MRLFFSRLSAFKKFEVIWTTRAELTILSVNLTFFYFSTFFIGAVLLSQKIKMNFFSTMINSLATLALVAHYLHKYFKHVYLKCGNELVSENSDIQLQSGN